MLILAAGADGELDEARVTAAIEWASSEADSYLSARYPTPISPVPPILTNCVGDIARYRLTGHNTLENEVILPRQMSYPGTPRNLFRGEKEHPRSDKPFDACGKSGKRSAV